MSLFHLPTCPLSMHSLTIMKNSHSGNTPYSLVDCCKAQHPLQELVPLSSTLSILELHMLSRPLLAEYPEKTMPLTTQTTLVDSRKSQDIFNNLRFKEGSKRSLPQQNCLLNSSLLEKKIVSHLQAKQLSLPP